MKQIKTVIHPIERAHIFDSEINRLLIGGWVLKKRTVTNMRGEVSEAFNTAIIQALYAELERYIPPFPEEVTL